MVKDLNVLIKCSYVHEILQEKKFLTICSGVSSFMGSIVLLDIP